VEAFAAIPERFRERLRNVAIVVEDAPTAEQRVSCDISSGEGMYAFYEGTSLIERDTDGDPVLPDRIVVFQRSFEEDFDELDTLQVELKKTIWHEIAHHFGIEDDRLEELGKY
ncbi:MAG: metallopeptidase family protein, partial [Candidatus Uhrbacteria bacterium]